MTEEEYYGLIKPYEDAMKMCVMRLEVLKQNLNETAYRPIHSMQSRIKKKASIEGKLERKEMNPIPSNAKNYLQDIAGIRVICYFVDDIFHLVKALKKQADLVLICEKDYIHCPKPNGYRSYHLIIGVPVYYLDSMEYFPVEIQLRTMAMDLWASMEHRILYKKKYENRKQVAEDLKHHAEMLIEIERHFEKYSEGMLYGKE